MSRKKRKGRTPLMGSITGRITSGLPAIQNIPIRTKEGRRLRDAFMRSPVVTEDSKMMIIGSTMYWVARQSSDGEDQSGRPILMSSRVSDAPPEQDIQLEDGSAHLPGDVFPTAEEAWGCFIRSTEEKGAYWRSILSQEEELIKFAKQQLDELRRKNGRGVFRWTMDEWAQEAAEDAVELHLKGRDEQTS